MNITIKKVLKKINDLGYEAFVVGGFVRDYFLGNNTFDIDITTSMHIEDLENTFSCISNGFGGIKFNIGKYNFEITSYRKEIEYEKRKPVKFDYAKTLKEDLLRRDFTINTLCMDKDGNVIDLLGGINDLNNKIIKSLNDPDTKFSEDPLRILRAIRFASKLGFTFEEETLKSIIKNRNEILLLSDERIISELTEILLYNGYSILEKCKITDTLNMSCDNLVYVNDICAIWAQIDAKKVYLNKSYLHKVQSIREILLHREINNFTIFNYGLNNTYLAAEIMGIDKKYIYDIYRNMPIKCMNDIKISGSEIMKILNIEPSKKVSDIIFDIKKEILCGTIKNTKKELISFVEGKYKHEQR